MLNKKRLNYPKHKNLNLLLFVSAAFSLAGGLFGPLYAVFVEQIGGDLITAGSAYAIFAISTGSLIYFIGKWEDRVKHQEKLIVISCALLAVGFFGYMLIQRPMHLFMVQIIFGFSEALGTPAYDSVYSKNLIKGKYASGWGMWESMHYIIVAIAATAGGFIAESFGFKTLFFFMFLLSLVGLLISLNLLKKR